mgnify:CR=1 FL=1
MIDYTKSREVVEIIDSTLLRSDVLDKDIEQLCSDAKEYEFAAVIVNPLHVKKARKMLRGTPVKVGTVVAFPLGEEFTSVKVMQIKKALKAGAQDIDVVAPISQIKQGNWEYIFKEIKKIKRASRRRTVKMIIETGLLTNEEVIKVSEVCVQAGVRFIKTCTGYNGTAQEESIKLILRTIKAKQRSESALGIDKDQNTIEVKASGGIKTLEQALEFYNLGVKRIGTSSALEIAKQAKLYYGDEPKDLIKPHEENVLKDDSLVQDIEQEIEEIIEQKEVESEEILKEEPVENDEEKNSIEE